MLRKKKKEGNYEHVEKFGIKKAPLLAFGEEEKRGSPLSLPPSFVCPCRLRPVHRPVFSFLSHSLAFFSIQIRMSRAQFWFRTIVAQVKKKFRSFVLESFFLFVDSSSHHYPPELCDVPRAALWLDRGRACAGAWVALRMNREYAQGVANEQFV
jgi:hypothetical protein